MRVFLTGATGFIGSAIVSELQAAGHTVLGLARSDAAAESLAALGVAAHRGELTDTESLMAGARACDGVIHTAFIRDFSKFEANIAIDRRAVEALAAALEGSGKPFVMTSGTATLTPGRIGTEQDEPATGSGAHLRGATEAVIVQAAGRGVRGSVVRLPPSVHGAGGPRFRAHADRRRTPHGCGCLCRRWRHRWPAVHRLDAAHLFRLALEQAPAGTRLHGTAEAGVPMRAIAEAIGAGLGIPARGLNEDEAGHAFRLDGALRRDRQSDVQRAHPHLAGMAAAGTGAVGGHARQRYFA